MRSCQFEASFGKNIKPFSGRFIARLITLAFFGGHGRTWANTTKAAKCFTGKDLRYKQPVDSTLHFGVGIFCKAGVVGSNPSAGCRLKALSHKVVTGGLTPGPNTKKTRFIARCAL